MSPHAAADFRRRQQSPFAPKYKRVPGEGPAGKVKLMMIGERPGELEGRMGRPFVGPSGQFLDVCLSVAALERSDIWITNLVKDFQSHGKPTRAEIDRDHAELVQEILDHDPDVIGLVGGWAVENVLNRVKAEMEKVSGVPVRVPALFGDELPRAGGWVVIPLLHPAGSIHQPESSPMILDGFIRTAQLIDSELAIIEDTITETDYRIVIAEDLDEILP